MARLIVQGEGQPLKEFVIGGIATIGRLADNTVALDSSAVSSHHACLFREGDQFVIEDLQSTNGTFVNGKRVSRGVLRDGDVLLIGHHTFLVDRVGEDEATGGKKAESPSSQDGTLFLDTRSVLQKFAVDSHEYKKYEMLIARLKEIESHNANTEAGGAIGAVGVLRVLDGRSRQSAYELHAHTSLIGRAKSSLVRLPGWFKPKVAVVITRNRQGYVATLLRGKTLINDQPVSGRHELKDGDVLWISGLLLEFGVKSTEASAAV